MTIEFLDPTYAHDAPAAFLPAPRLATLKGAIVAIVSNGKKGSVAFFDTIATQLLDRYGVGEVVRLTKANYSAPMDMTLLSDASRWHALIAGIGD
jgi:hypothetical protein